MQTGVTNPPAGYPNQPPGSPPPLDHRQMSGSYIQQTPPLQHQQSGIAGSPMEHMEHPKGDYYGQPQQQQIPQQQGIPMQQVQTQPMGLQPQQSQYQSATPLQNLQGVAMPVDCPMCRHRAMTRIEYHSGNTTQYAIPPHAPVGANHHVKRALISA